MCSALYNAVNVYIGVVQDESGILIRHTTSVGRILFLKRRMMIMMIKMIMMMIMIMMVMIMMSSAES